MGDKNRTGTECCRVHLTGAVGTEASQQLKANVSLHTHRAGMNLKDVRATLKHKSNRGEPTEARRTATRSDGVLFESKFMRMCLHVSSDDSPPDQAG